MYQAKPTLSPTPVTRATLPLKSMGIMRVPVAIGCGGKRGASPLRSSRSRKNGQVESTSRPAPAAGLRRYSRRRCVVEEEARPIVAVSRDGADLVPFGFLRVETDRHSRQVLATVLRSALLTTPRNDVRTADDRSRGVIFVQASFREPSSAARGSFRPSVASGSNSSIEQVGWHSVRGDFHAIRPLLRSSDRRFRNFHA